MSVTTNSADSFGTFVARNIFVWGALFVILFCLSWIFRCYQQFGLLDAIGVAISLFIICYSLWRFVPLLIFCITRTDSWVLAKLGPLSIFLFLIVSPFVIFLACCPLLWLFDITSFSMEHSSYPMSMRTTKTLLSLMPTSLPVEERRALLDGVGSVVHNSNFDDIDWKVVERQIPQIINQARTSHLNSAKSWDASYREAAISRDAD